MIYILLHPRWPAPTPDSCQAIISGPRRISNQTERCAKTLFASSLRNIVCCVEGEPNACTIQMSFPLRVYSSSLSVVPRKRLHCLPLSIGAECRIDRQMDRGTRRARRRANRRAHSLIPIRDRVSKIYCRSSEEGSIKGKDSRLPSGWRRQRGRGRAESTNWYCCKYTMCFASRGPPTAPHRTAPQRQQKRINATDGRTDRPTDRPSR